MMKNRIFALALSTGLAVSAVFGTAPAVAEGKTIIRFSTPASQLDPLYQAMQKFKEEVGKKAPEFDVQLFPANQLFRQGTEVPAMQRGSLEMGTLNVPELTQRLPEFGFFNRAFAFKDWPEFERAFNGPAGKALREAVRDKLGIVMLAPSYMGARHLALRRQMNVAKPADLAGVKLRVPGAPEWIAMGKVLGVNPTPMALPDVYLALQSGAIDGVENPVSIIKSTKHDEVTKQLVLTSHMIMSVHLSITKSMWDKLNPSQQKVIGAAAASAAAWNTDQRLSGEQATIEEFAKKGIKVAETDLAAFKDNATKVYADESFAKTWNKALMKEAGLAD